MNAFTAPRRKEIILTSDEAGEPKERKAGGQAR
jgi:hypothetical protein